LNNLIQTRENLDQEQRQKKKTRNNVPLKN
jgi:hypothetical protein